MIGEIEGSVVIINPEIAETDESVPAMMDEWDENDSSLMSHAKRELTLMGYDLNEQEEGPNKWIVENILELMRVFAKQGHSGSSAPYCINLFSKLAKYQIVYPLTGNSDEWMEVSDNLWQNVRDCRVFKNDKEAYFIDGKIFREPNGCCYTNKNSFTPVTFPCVPESIYVDVDEEGRPVSNGDIHS